jgi:DNA polymerase-3 subunit beta
MKVLVAKSELLALIGKIQGVVSPRPPLPALGNVLVEAMADQIVLTTTDLSVSIRVSAAAKVVEEGAIALPARKFFSLVRELTAPQVEIHSATADVALINAGSSHFKVQGMHKGEFPVFPDLVNGVKISLSASMLREMLGRTVFAAAREDSRQILNGILLQKEGSSITCVATDGKKLAQMRVSVEDKSDQKGVFVLPVKAVEEIVKMLEESDKAVNLTLTSDKCAVEGPGTTLVAKLLAGQYPDFTRIIPKKGESSIALHREELISLLRQVSLFTSEESCAVRLSFNAGALHLSAMSGDIGEGQVSMPVNYAGPRLDIAFNPHYFLDVLRHSKDETVNFDASDAYNPGLITDSSAALFVIMPMRLEPLAVAT